MEEICRTLEISRSGYYGWIKNAPSREERKSKRERLAEKVRQIHEESLRSSGSPRILKVLQGEGIQCGKHRLEKLMHEEGISGKQKRKWRATTDSTHGNPVLPNRLDWKFEVHEPNRKWVSDITCCATDEGWLHVAAIMDLYSRTIVGWATGDRITTDLVVKTLDRALEEGSPCKGLILHSDRGSQYTSHAYQMKLWNNEILGSMSRKGNCWDNAPMESFFGTMKTECVYGRRKYRTRDEATTDFFRYREVFLQPKASSFRDRI